MKEERDKAMKLVHGMQWKGRVLSVRLAKPKADPILRKRRQEEGAADSGEPVSKHASQEPENDEPLSVQIADVVTPLWKVPYDEQLRRKEQEVEAILQTLARYPQLVKAKLNNSIGTVYWVKLSASCCPNYDKCFRARFVYTVLSKSFLHILLPEIPVC